MANPGRDSAQGFGLGLVIVHRLCKAFGYTIAVRSVQDRGSCFSVTMPLASATVPMDEGAALPETPSPPVSRATTLLVDDDPMIRDAMQRLFAEWEVHAQIVASSDQALDAAASVRQPWDCLLLDLRLGGSLNGVQLGERLQEILGYRLPVAILTGEADGPVLVEARALGYTVLRKPVKMMRLRAFLTASAAGPAAPRRSS